MKQDSSLLFRSRHNAWLCDPEGVLPPFCCDPVRGFCHSILTAGPERPAAVCPQSTSCSLFPNLLFHSCSPELWTLESGSPEGFEGVMSGLDWVFQMTFPLQSQIPFHISHSSHWITHLQHLCPIRLPYFTQHSTLRLRPNSEYNYSLSTNSNHFSLTFVKNVIR